MRVGRWSAAGFLPGMKRHPLSAAWRGLRDTGAHVHCRPGTATDPVLHFQHLPRVWFVKVKKEENGKPTWPHYVRTKNEHNPTY